MAANGPILIATDFSDKSAEAVRQGYARARETSSAVVFTHIVPEAFRARLLFPHNAGIDDSTQRQLLQSAEGALRAQVKAALGFELSADQWLLETGSSHSGILAIAEKVGADLVVVGPGSTAQRVARSAGRPVLVARPSPASGEVLGATDFSDPAVPALRAAQDEASRRNVALRVLHCLDIDASAYFAAAGVHGGFAAVPFPENVVTQLEADAEQRLRELAIKDAGIVVRRESPFSGIMHEAAAAGASLIVVGTHGRSGLARLALGSVAEHVLREAPCSVMVVPLHEA